MSEHRLINQLFQNPEFKVDQESLGYIVRDIINMNWWNTSGILIGYAKNKRINNAPNETQKRIAVQLKEYYRVRIIGLKNESKLREEIRKSATGVRLNLRQLSAYSMRCRANPSQFFHKKDGAMTWVDCTSRATYAMKYVYQNGFIDFDGICRVKGAQAIVDAIKNGQCEDLGILDHFVDGDNLVKSEIFSQKKYQKKVSEWVDELGVDILPERAWLFEKIRDVRSDPYKIFEAECLSLGIGYGVNERLYNFATSNTSDTSRASSASRASRASSAGDASNASGASDAGCMGFKGNNWENCPTAIKKPDHLVYPPVFRSNIFAIAGSWKIDKEVAALAKKGWFDPFSGHGTTPIFAKGNGIKYVGFDTNKSAFDQYLNVVNEELEEIPGQISRVHCRDSTVFYPEFIGQFDLCYTSPPYFNFEEYGGNTGHFSGCQTYEDFHKKITIPVFKNVMRYLVPGGIMALQLEKDKTKVKKWCDVIESIGYVKLDSRLTGTEKMKYSTQAKRDQSLLIFCTQPT